MDVSDLDLELGTVVNGGLKASVFARRNEDEGSDVGGEVLSTSNPLQASRQAFSICMAHGRSALTHGLRPSLEGSDVSRT